VVGLTVRSMVTVAKRRPRRQPAMRPTQAHLRTLSLLPTRGTGNPPRENDAIIWRRHTPHLRDLKNTAGILKICCASR